MTDLPVVQKTTVNIISITEVHCIYSLIGKVICVAETDHSEDLQ